MTTHCITLNSDTLQSTAGVCKSVIQWLYWYVILIYLTSTVLFVFFFCFFSAGVTGILPTEIFNQAARPAAYMIAGSMMWLNLFVVGMIFPFLVVSLLLHPHFSQRLSICPCIHPISKPAARRNKHKNGVHMPIILLLRQDWGTV